MESSTPTNDPHSASPFSGADAQKEPPTRSRRRTSSGTPGGPKPTIFSTPESRKYFTESLGLGGQPADQPKQTSGQGNGGEPPKKVLKLRLDLNLDIEVQIKAKIHGDVTLSLL
jgi:hypothetical protein